MRDAIDVEMSGILGNIPRSVKSQEILEKSQGNFKFLESKEKQGIYHFKTLSGFVSFMLVVHIKIIMFMNYKTRFFVDWIVRFFFTIKKKLNK